MSRWSNLVAVFTLALAACLLPWEEAKAAEPCFASVPQQIDDREIPNAPLTWTCDSAGLELDSERIALRFRLDQTEQSDVRSFETRNGFFRSLTLIAEAPGEALAIEHHRSREVRPQSVKSALAVPLPAIGAPPVAYYAVFEDLEYEPTAAQARLVDAPMEAAPWAVRERILVAAICGFLLLPILLNLAYWRVLREEFLLWHAALALSMSAHLMTSGLLVELIPVSANAMASLAVGTFSLVVITAMLFASAIVEPDKLDPRVRKAVGWSAIWILLVTFLRLAQPDMLRPVMTILYFGSFLVPMGLVVWAIVDALRRGSSAIRFQMLAWAPLFALGITRIGTMLIADTSYIEGAWWFRIGAAWEVLITALGVVDRVMTIKRERDLALAKATVLEDMAKHDALTGLLNRRAVEARFAQLRDDGFHTIALVDLDHFKQVNDSFGHQVGDDVLRAAAEAMRGDGERDCVAFRMGGEEFMLLLRGKDSVRRVEHTRRSITVRVARLVAALDRPVTASMGVVELAGGDIGGIDFDTLYERADRLLYEAKETGRNRMVHERLTLFGKDSASARDIQVAA